MNCNIFGVLVSSAGIETRD